MTWKIALDHATRVASSVARWGDALGAPVEFDTLVTIRKRFGDAGIRNFVPAYGRAGSITNDTQMTLFSAEGLLRARMRGADTGVCPCTRR